MRLPPLPWVLPLLLFIATGLLPAGYRVGVGVRGFRVHRRKSVVPQYRKRGHVRELVRNPRDMHTYYLQHRVRVMFMLRHWRQLRLYVCIRARGNDSLLSYYRFA